MFPKIDWLVSSKVKRDVDIDGISVKQLKFDHDARPFFVSLNLRWDNPVEILELIFL